MPENRLDQSLGMVVTLAPADAEGVRAAARKAGMGEREWIEQVLRHELVRTLAGQPLEPVSEERA